MKLKGFICGFLALGLCMPLQGFAQAGAMDKTEQSAATQEKSNLTVHIVGIRNNSGVIRIAMYNSRQAYEDNDPTGTAAFKRHILPIQNGAAVWRLDGIPYGVYGIKLFHDENNSGKLKRTFIGRPAEGVAFSSNPKLGNHAPRFDEVKFVVNKPESSITIRMINP
jgi:uncharacterized protein (DUF2141 family)